MRLRITLSLLLLATIAQADTPAQYVVMDLRTTNFEWCDGATPTNVNRIQSSNASYTFAPAILAAAISVTTSTCDVSPTTIGTPTALQLLECAAERNDCSMVTKCDCKDPNGGDVSELSASVNDFAAWAALEVAAAHAGEAESRWISTKGDVLRIYVISNKGAKPELTIKDEPRKTILAIDFKTLLKAASLVTGALANNQTRSYDVGVYEYRLTNRRSTLTLTATYTKGTEKKTVTGTLTTGPAEHFFLAGDVPISQGKQLTFDDEHNQIIQRDDPTAFYASLNFRSGDLFLDNTWWQKVVIKGLVAASRRPADAYGIGVGLRGDLFGKWGIDLDAFSPFVAWVSTKNTEEAVKKGAKDRSSDVRFGISVSVDKVVEMLKPKEKDKSKDE